MNPKPLKLINFLEQNFSAPPSEISYFNDLLSYKEFGNNDFVVQEASTPMVAYVETGLLKSFYRDIDGNEYVKDFYKAGEIAANYKEILMGLPESELIIQSIEPAKVFLIDGSKFRKLNERHICWERLNALLAEKYFLNRDLREKLLLISDTKQRIANFEAKSPELIGLVNSYDIASYLGMNPSTYSRTKKK